MTFRIIKPVNVWHDETVEIRWRNAAGEVLVERHQVPPQEVWKVRYAMQESRRQAPVPADVAEEGAGSLDRGGTVPPVREGS